MDDKGVDAINKMVEGIRELLNIEGKTTKSFKTIHSKETLENNHSSTNFIQSWYENRRD